MSEIINEKDDLLKLGNSQFRLSYLRSVTLEEAIRDLTSGVVIEDRVRNAWKRANKKK